MSLRVHKLACVRGDKQLFSDISFEINAGEALWLSGNNGSGKTSLLRLLCGLSSPHAGEVRWQGQDIRTLHEDFSKDLLYCGHANGLKDDLTAWENVYISSRLAGKKCTQESAYHALDRVGLTSVAHLPAGSLSQGQRKRVALARLWIYPTPTLIVLDEPFTSLDTQAVNALCDMLNQHSGEGGVVIYTTHQELRLKPRRLHSLNLSQLDVDDSSWSDRWTKVSRLC